MLPDMSPDVSPGYCCRKLAKTGPHMTVIRPPKNTFYTRSRRMLQVTSYESLNSFLRAEDNERSGANEEATHVGSDIIDSDDGHGEDVPDHTVSQCQVHQIPSSGQVECGNMCPCYSIYRFLICYFCNFVDDVLCHYVWYHYDTGCPKINVIMLQPIPTTWGHLF